MLSPCGARIENVLAQNRALVSRRQTELMHDDVEFASQ